MVIPARFELTIQGLVLNIRLELISSLSDVIHYTNLTKTLGLNHLSMGPYCQPENYSLTVGRNSKVISMRCIFKEYNSFSN